MFRFRGIELQVDLLEEFADLDDNVTRARQLAAGLRARWFSPDLPAWLHEPTYLLDEAHQPGWSLPDRLRILGLMATSIDQHFIAQLSLLPGEAEPGNGDVDQGAANAPELLMALLQQATTFLNTEILPGLGQHNLSLATREELARNGSRWLQRFFYRRVYPLLVPLAVDPGRPFPFISSFSLNVLVNLRDPHSPSPWEAPFHARVKVPRLIPRFVEVEGAGNGPTRVYVWAEELVRSFLPDLFPGLEVEEAYLFRVLRAHGRLSRWRRDLLANDPGRLQPRTPVTRLDVETGMPQPMLDWLVGHLSVPSDSVFRLDSPLNQTQLVDLANLVTGHQIALAEKETDLAGWP